MSYWVLYGLALGLQGGGSAIMVGILEEGLWPNCSSVELCRLIESWDAMGL